MNRRERQRMVLAWRDIDGLTLREIGDRLGLSHERVRQICNEARREPPRSHVQYGPCVSTLSQALTQSFYATVLLRWARGG